jgi:hypothetical protein
MSATPEEQVLTVLLVLLLLTMALVWFCIAITKRPRANRRVGLPAPAPEALNRRYADT